MSVGVSLWSSILRKVGGLPCTTYGSRVHYQVPHHEHPIGRGRFVTAMVVGRPHHQVGSWQNSSSGRCVHVTSGEGHFFRRFLVRTFFVRCSVQFSRTTTFTIQGPYTFRGYVLVMGPPTLRTVVTRHASIRLRRYFTTNDLVRSVSVLHSSHF